MEPKQKKRLTFISIMMIILGSVSFSNYVLVGKVLVIVGLVLLVTTEVMWRRKKTQ